jgi:hypothetical protein
MDIVDWLKGQAAVHAAAGESETATMFDIAVAEIESRREACSIDQLLLNKKTSIMHELYKFLTPVQIETAYQIAYNNNFKPQKGGI